MECVCVDKDEWCPVDGDGSSRPDFERVRTESMEIGHRFCFFFPGLTLK